MSKKMSRREFLKVFPSASLVAAAGWSLGSQILSSCTHFERRLSGEKEKYDKEVIILGGGIAGLSLAHYLRKEKIPFQLFEASYRLGGRIYSTPWQKDNVSGFSELGASHVAAFHERSLALLKDYLVPTLEVPAPAAWNWMGRSVSSKAELKKFLQWREQKEKSLFRQNLISEQRQTLWLRQGFPLWNQQSSKEFAESLSFFITHDDYLWNSFFITQFGMSMDQLSSLYFLEVLVKGPQIPLWKSFSKTIKLKTASSDWFEAMGQRLMGSIPGRFIHLESPCVGLQMDDDWVQVQIQSPTGLKKFNAKNVVVALPAWRWKTIPGLMENLSISDSWMGVAHEQILYGESGTKVLSEKNMQEYSPTSSIHSWDHRAFIEGSRAYLTSSTQIQDLDLYKRKISQSKIHFTSSVLGDRFVDELEGALQSSWNLAKSIHRV